MLMYFRIYFVKKLLILYQLWNLFNLNSTFCPPYLVYSGFNAVFLCAVYSIWVIKNVNALIATELAGITYTRLLTMNSKFSIPHSAKPPAVLKLLVHC